MKIGISNLKGGVGKTTLSVNIAVRLAHMGYSVCVIDTDANQNAVSWRAARDESLPELTVVGITDYKALSKQVSIFERQNDFIIMDGNPNLGEITSTIILYSDILLVPIRAGANDYRSMNHFFSLFRRAEGLRPDGIKAYFVINEYNEKKNISRMIKENLGEFGLPIMETAIRSRVAYEESSMNGTGVVEQGDPKAKLEIESLTNEILENTWIPKRSSAPLNLTQD